MNSKNVMFQTRVMSLLAQNTDIPVTALFYNMAIEHVYMYTCERHNRPCQLS